MDNLAVSASPIKTSSISSSGESGQTQLTGASRNKAQGGGVATSSVRRRVTTDDALSFTLEVKQTFQAEREKYKEYVDVLVDFNFNRIGVDAVVGRVKELLKGHDGLLDGFRIFLPDGYEIIGVDAVVGRVKELLKGHDCLLDGKLN
ncbi:hypothetical protein POM88_030515 [Heracleum sosnowskyi]|uniref:Uncharacterized protein n=1 Tax=Heracleum sosnowskyi TaxID=360622 RepID=A0AAD8HXJ5_9APIA|nr:hypothetical protein POM88_030515 [Heracleum sosnowskyi]